MSHNVFRIILLLASLGSFFCLYSENSSSKDPIFVRLLAEERLLPLYLTASAHGKKTEISPAYLSEIVAVLAFDLSHNGMTQTLAPSKELDSLAQSYFDGSVESEEWS